MQAWCMHHHEEMSTLTYSHECGGLGMVGVPIVPCMDEPSPLTALVSADVHGRVRPIEEPASLQLAASRHIPATRTPPSLTLPHTHPQLLSPLQVHYSPSRAIHVVLAKPAEDRGAEASSQRAARSSLRRHERRTAWGLQEGGGASPSRS